MAGYIETSDDDRLPGKFIHNMHEASIAENIIEITRQHLPPDGRGRVKAIRLKIGECSGIEPESLRFCFEALVSHTDLQGATLAIESVPFRIACRQCGEVTRTEFGFMECGQCHGMETRVVSGHEMQITEIEITEEEPV